MSNDDLLPEPVAPWVNDSTALEQQPSDSATLSPSSTAETVKIPLAIQLPIVALAALGLFTWMFHRDEKLATPIADLTTLSWLALLLIASLLHLVRGITLPGGGGFEFAEKEVIKRDSAQRSSEGFLRLLGIYARQLQSWTRQAARLNDDLMQGNTEDEDARLVLAFCYNRMDEARLLIAEPRERVRVTLYLLAKNGVLFQLLSNDKSAARTTAGSQRFNDGPLRKALDEDATINLASGGLASGPRTGAVKYRGLLLVPLRRQGRPVGIVAFERERAKRSNPEQVVVISALADILVLALSHPAAPKSLLLGDSPS